MGGREIAPGETIFEMNRPARIKSILEEYQGVRRRMLYIGIDVKKYDEEVARLTPGLEMVDLTDR